MRDVVLRGPERDVEGAAIARQEDAAVVVGIPVAGVLNDLTSAPLMTFKAMLPRSGAVGSGVIVAVMTLPLVVSDSVAFCCAAMRAARSSEVTNS